MSIQTGVIEMRSEDGTDVTEAAIVEPVRPESAVLQNVGRAFLNSNMRASPVQQRAQLTVDRIIAAGRGVGLREGREGFTLHAVAAAANIRLGAVYRYFSTPDDLIRTIVRVWVTRMFGRYRERLSVTRFKSTEDVVEHLAGSIERIIDNDLFEPEIPRRIRLMLYRDYHEVPYAELLQLAAEVRAAMSRDGIDSGAPENTVRLALAMASASALCKMAVVHAPETIKTDYFRAQLRGLFREALVC